MGTVTVTGRDELGRIIDVTLTTNADVAPPGPEVVPEGGGSGGAQSMSLLGPFAVEFDTPGLQSGGALLTELDAGTWLWGVAVVGVVAPAAATFLSFQVSLGGPDALDLDGGWSTSDSDDISPSPNNSVIVPGSGPFTAVTFRPVGLIIEGGLYANWGVVDATEGEWDIYALIAEPSA